MHRFFVYHSSLPVDPARPWQLCTEMGCLLGRFATKDRAEVALDALERDADMGTLPCNLRLWDKVGLLSD